MHEPRADAVLVREVGLRDGLQMVAQFMPTPDKLAWIRAEHAAGVREIEVTSLVPARLAPQFADAEAVVREALALPGLCVVALVPNLRGAERAFELGVHKLDYVVSVSRTHNLRNVRREREASLEDLARIVRARDEAGLRGRVRVAAGLSTALGCSYEGRIAVDEVRRCAAALFEAGADEVVIPVVGECDDSWLDDMRRRWVTAEHARQALAAASDGPVAEGVVGAGTGMITMGHKAGIGTSSRVIDGIGTVGVLLLCNFGGRELLRLGGRPVGPTLHAEALAAAPPGDTGGSCLGVVFTDIPLDARQLRRVATRVGLGLARVGSVAHHGSGDIFLAVSTANRVGRDATGLLHQTVLADGSLNDVFSAVVDASEEAVANALFVADTVTGVDGNVVKGIPVRRVLQLLDLPVPSR